MSRAIDCLISADCLRERVLSSSGQRPLRHMTIERRSMLSAVDVWFDRARQRRELRELMDSPEETFRDIGLSRYDVQREQRKPFWRQ